MVLRKEESMPAGFPVAMRANLAEPEIDDMGAHDRNNCRNKQPNMEGMPNLFGHEKKNANGKNKDGSVLVMVVPEPVG